jgi:hypothetical protein
LKSAENNRMASASGADIGAWRIPPKVSARIFVHLHLNAGWPRVGGGSIGVSSFGCSGIEGGKSEHDWRAGHGGRGGPSLFAIVVAGVVPSGGL